MHSTHDTTPFTYPLYRYAEGVKLAGVKSDDARLAALVLRYADSPVTHHGVMAESDMKALRDRLDDALDAWKSIHRPSLNTAEGRAWTETKHARSAASRLRGVIS